MLLFSAGSPATSLSPSDMKSAVNTALTALGPRSRVLIIPPDITRLHSRAGDLTRCIWEYYGSHVKAILPALGTHAPMTEHEITRMFGNVPAKLFRIHDWRNDTVTVGTIHEKAVADFTNNQCSLEWPAQINRLLVEGNFDCIISIGQVVPHEVAGMANHAKNIFVGTGGAASIHSSHFIGAVCGMESCMGRIDTPVRKLFNHAAVHFTPAIPLVYFQTVIDTDGITVRGLYAGSDSECFEKAAHLSQSVNITLLKNPLRKVLVYLDPQEYRSTWLGNKAIYRTRMALADKGELIILAPGINKFGEDPHIDKIIRTYGYCGTPTIMHAVKNDQVLKGNLSAAAHLIHGSTEGRFSVTYCPGFLSQKEIEKAGYQFADITSMLNIFYPEKLVAGINHLPTGEEIFFVPNPALGLWAEASKFL